MPLHLPLNAIDKANKPPAYYLTVQDGLILLSSALWTVSYVLYVRQAFRDKSYGMPLVPLWGNIVWEFLFAVVVPNSVAQVVAFTPWLMIDVVIIYTTQKFGPEQWESSPLVAQNLGWIMALGIFLTLILFWGIVKTIGSADASFYIAYIVQLAISSYSVAQLVSRGNTSGHSWGIWFFRATGTAATIAQFIWKYVHYPQSYPKVALPLTQCLFALCTIIDLMYPFVYMAIEQNEGRYLKT